MRTWLPVPLLLAIAGCRCEPPPFSWALVNGEVQGLGMNAQVAVIPRTGRALVVSDQTLDGICQALAAGTDVGVTLRFAQAVPGTARFSVIPPGGTGSNRTATAQYFDDQGFRANAVSGYLDVLENENGVVHGVFDLAFDDGHLDGRFDARACPP